MDNDFQYKFIKPDHIIADFVENLGTFHNASNEPKEVVVIPDGRIDLFLSQSPTEPFHITLLGLETYPEQRQIPPKTTAFIISFKPIAVEYILQASIADLLNTGKELPPDFWGFTADDIQSFELCSQKATEIIKELLPVKTDERKLRLFELMYLSNGEMSVQELSEQVGWSSRQINRYFTKQLGLSLKAYCTILRFRASLEHIAHGKLFPELNYTDQNHFIKEIKKFSGVAPKELSKNKNDRFVLLSVLKGE
ncbi:helix-turn-helix transcriptional regulator [Chryseobacterium indologenes]|uniref:AraC family transcriptional regulator n=1 Tax=Chryseobacterium indologenes TaxID=253 RepID=A0A4U8VGF9_CHRID|nr:MULTISPECIES: AraC family transcriptional regulator [Chryseobacterium]AZB16441.1 AraC family transcriptional regulator [Chryseobacterium indologenes]QPQ50929.1 helix-turn-helix transcriptional regulator [Chryseobacterium indologenes]TLX24101.1 helix-turn-helix transcriptional regulator [Chryseobacterium indologenes]SFJ11357.1 Helix-turn-helix domain-containing protein [Chryseobacterium indologenes]SUX49259.1 Adenosine deaminase [Chryseobacterium indologenes]